MVLTGLALAVAGAVAISQSSEPYMDGGAAPILGTIGVTLGGLGMFGATFIPDTFTLASTPTR